MGLLGSIGSIAGGAIGSYFGGPAGGAIGSSIGQEAGNFLSGAANSAISYHYDMKQAKELAKYNMELQKELNEYNALNRYPWAVKSLRDAGLNPILAATQGAPLSGGSVQAQAINAKRGQDIINTATALGQLDNLEAQNKNLKAQNDFIKAQTLNELNSAREIEARVQALDRDLKWWRDNPRFYSASMASKAIPHPLTGGSLALLTTQLQGNSSRTVNTRNYPRGYFYEDSK